jgi:hypothetical protein
MTFTATDPSSHQSENIWFTPKYIIEKLGGFDLLEKYTWINKYQGQLGRN